MHREEEMCVFAGLGARTWSQEGFPLDPQSKWTYKRNLVWTHASSFVRHMAHPYQPRARSTSASAPTKAVSLAFVKGRKLEWGHKIISKTHRGVESPTTSCELVEKFSAQENRFQPASQEELLRYITVQVWTKIPVNHWSSTQPFCVPPTVLSTISLNSHGYPSR